jgi:stress response protein YsnF
MENKPAQVAQGPVLIVPVAREEVRVGVRQVDRGSGVRIHKTVSEQPHTVAHDLQRDTYDIRHVPVDRVVPLSEAPATRQEGDTLIVPVLEEILVVEKRVRIKEEIHIVRSTSTHPYSGTVMLRAEAVSVERFNEQPDPEVTTTDGGTHHATHTDSRIR